VCVRIKQSNIKGNKPATALPGSQPEYEHKLNESIKKQETRTKNIYI